MNEKQLFTIIDLGGGDGGKGGVVHAISCLKRAHTIIKVGGAQGSHGVRTAAGQNFNFKQFGCGTFEGVKTHISELMVIEPYTLIEEGKQLKYTWGINNVFDYLTIDAEALCVTPFQTIASRLRELSRKEKQKGTVGFGAGETMLDSELHPNLTIRAKDLRDQKLYEKLKLIRLQKINDLEKVIEQIPNFWEKDQKMAQELLNLLNDPGFINRIVERFNTLGSLVKIVDSDYLRKTILARNGVIVVESSHGILTDRYYGFCPYVSRLRTLPMATLKLLADYDYDGEIIKLGVTRAYQIRHGAGPMVTECSKWLEKILPGSNKEENRWQGKVRIGPLDLVALKYAIAVCGGPKAFSALAITWFDQIQALGKWNLCPSYQKTSDRNFFVSNKQIRVRRYETGDELNQINHQTQLAQKLFQCRPNLISYDVSEKSRDELTRLCAKFLGEELEIPVRMISYGPTEKNKIFF